MSYPESYTLQIKRVFLNFLQQYFSTSSVDERYRWSSDYKQTRIIIADKNGVDRPTNEKRPLLILSRNSVRPMFSSLKQRLSRQWHNNLESYMDLLEGSVVINCLSKSGVQAEELAHITMLSILAFRDSLKGYNGIHQITNIQIGEESNVLVDVNSVLVNVPVIVQFTKNIAWTPAPLLSSAGKITYQISGISYYWYEALDYDVFRNRLTTYEALPSGSTASVTYLHNTTLATTTETLSGINGITTVFYLSNPVYSYYPVVQTIQFSGLVSGITYAYSGGLTEPTYSGWVITTSGFSGMLS